MNDRNRGLASALLIVMLGGLVLFGLGWAVLDPHAEALFADGVNDDGQYVSQGAIWLRTVWRFGPFVLLTALSVYIVQRGVFESRGGV